MNFYGNTAVVEFLNVNLTPGSVWFMAASQTRTLNRQIAFSARKRSSKIYNYNTDGKYSHHVTK